MSNENAEGKAGCRHFDLAKSSVGSVAVCECGMIHLHMGALTLRFTATAFAELRGTLDRAQVEHDRHTTGTELDNAWIDSPQRRGVA